MFNYLLSVQILLLSLNRNKLPSLYARVLLRYQNGIRLKETWRQKYLNREKIPFLKELEVKKAASIREAILPGYGHIYLEDFWRGFPILFISLLLWLFIAVWSFSYLSPIFGIQFLSSMGLKPGISDKDFFVSSQNIMYLAISILAFIFIYLYSRHLLSQSFTLQNLGYKKAQSDDEKEPVFASGVRKGFRNILPLSLLFHFILLCLVFIIPISLQRNSAKKKEKSDQASHFQPEKMEFYFIDPNVPDTTKGLNGGVYTGNETKTENGEKISDKKLSDNGPKSGYIKKIRGKKVPPTYSNYISAKMRVPESYLEYWSKAPQPYSSVVAYTITKDGDIIDVELVEGSNYPDQDRLTLELVERMGPLMPPPESEGSIRVTELFWNGPVDPNYVPTPLQKEMVYMFDGRYMEEIDE
ncbi:putative membrane protein [Leptospira ryugenii]|uniref:Putative membrane protein n=1 Tax=Leptospira ryugenii TaxID=1917863 RepID=A0A2P2DZ72_9LEPT|nr:putative membrane protein [Leptospira ryugenii]